MKQAFNFICVLVIAFLFTTCKDKDENPTQDQNELTVSVKDGNGNTYPNTKVKVFNASREFEGVTNASGTFGFNINDAGTYKVTIVPPLSTMVIAADTVEVDVSMEVEKTIDFVIQPQALEALVVIEENDIFEEIKNEAGMVPVEPEEELYARNAFDAPIGMLTPIRAPNDNHLSLAEWRTATGTVNVHCNGPSSKVNITLQGMIPNGTYTFWLNFFNKKKLPGEVVNFGSDVVKIDPLGSGTLNVQQADGTGSITTVINHSSCILTEEVALVLVVDYHINGNTFGADHIPDEEDVNHLLIYFQ